MRTDAAHTPVVVDGLRTPFGRYGGALAGVRPDDLAAHVVRAVVQRTGVDPAAIDDVILGAANQSGEDNRNVGRMAALLAGLPVEVPGSTVNRLCGSGMNAVINAAHAVAARRPVRARGRGPRPLARAATLSRFGTDATRTCCRNSATRPPAGSPR